MAGMPSFFKVLFSPRGRMGQRDYLIGLVGIVAVFTGYGFILNALAGSMTGFFVVLAFPFIILQMAYSVYGKRLHDIGRSLWPVTALIAAIIGVMIIIMLAFGGAEYMTAYSEYARDETVPADVVKKLDDAFASQQKEGEALLKWIVSGLLGAFTLWLAFTPSEGAENRYGPIIEA